MYICMKLYNWLHETLLGLDTCLPILEVGFTERQVKQAKKKADKAFKKLIEKSKPIDDAYEGQAHHAASAMSIALRLGLKRGQEDKLHHHHHHHHNHNNHSNHQQQPPVKTSLLAVKSAHVLEAESEMGNIGSMFNQAQNNNMNKKNEQGFEKVIRTDKSVSSFKDNKKLIKKKSSSKKEEKEEEDKVGDKSEHQEEHQLLHGKRPKHIMDLHRDSDEIELEKARKKEKQEAEEKEQRDKLRHFEEEEFSSSEDGESQSSGDGDSSGGSQDEGGGGGGGGGKPNEFGIYGNDNDDEEGGDENEDEATRLQNAAIRNRNALRKLQLMANMENPSVRL
jgi:uncharacterized membrane protein YgcG